MPLAPDLVRRLRRPARTRLALVAAALGIVAITAGALVPHGPSAHTKAKPVDKSIWISLAELKQLPRSGDAWARLKATADGDLGEADISSRNSVHDAKTLAAALVFARTGKESYREKAVEAIMSAIGTEEGGSTLALGRNLVSYVIAADLVNLRQYSPERNAEFVGWLKTVRKEVLQGKTLISTQEVRPNNWGTHAGASRAAVDVYLGNRKDLERAAKVFKGWLGDRSAYQGFVFSEVDWQANPEQPVGVNPPGATKDGFSIDGALPPEMRRGGQFQFPPEYTDYPWGALAGALVEAQILSRQGYDAWSWGDQALRRAVQFLYDLDVQYGRWWADGDDAWEPWLVNAVYGTSFPTEPVLLPGKNMSWTDWTHAAGVGGPPPPPL